MVAPMNWNLAVAANDDALLGHCLLASPGARSASKVLVERGFPSAAQAYNAASLKAESDIVVFAHQDVYLPAGWDDRLGSALEHLHAKDPGWAVAGVVGIATGLAPTGYAYCTGLQRIVGAPFPEPVEAETLDELLLVVRRSSRLRFDEQLPGFHLYGTDICLTARTSGMKAYIIPAFCVHNTAGLDFLPVSFWRSYLYLRRKWRATLPIKTPCTTITRFGWPIVSHTLRSAYSCYVRGEKAGSRVKDPSALLRNLEDHGQSLAPVPKKRAVQAQ